MSGLVPPPPPLPFSRLVTLVTRSWFEDCNDVTSDCNPSTLALFDIVYIKQDMNNNTNLIKIVISEKRRKKVHKTK